MNLLAKYTELAQDILNHIGGKDNVLSVKHCVTRLRFQLKDKNKADTEFLKQRDGIVTVVEAGGQYQIVIGNHVSDVYDEVLKVSGLADGGSLDIDEGDIKKGNLFDRFIDVVSSLFQPFLGPLAAAGILKGVTAILLTLGLSQNNGIYVIMNALSDAFFQYLPIMLAVTSAKRFKMNVYTALGIAGALVYPGLIESVNSATKLFGVSLSLPQGGYYNTVLPILLAIWLASYIEKILCKLLPEVIKLFGVPFFTILITVPITFLVVGPIANTASDWISILFQSLYDFNPVIFGLILGTFWQILVMFGLHWGLVPLAIMDMTQHGSSILLVASVLPCFTQTGVLAAIWLKTKEKKVKEGVVPAFISSIFGVTEPAIYGYTLPMRIPFVISCLVSGLVGMYLSFCKVRGYTMGGLGIFVYPSFINPKTGSFDEVIHLIIGTVLAIVISFIIMLFFKVPILYSEQKQLTSDKISKKKETLKSEVNTEKNVPELVIKSPITGKIVSLENVPDKVFSSGVMGKGVAIDPEEGAVFAPTDGKVEMLFPTKHAIGILTKHGIKLLIHIGTDTVELGGKHFITHVNQGQIIMEGQKLVSFDSDAIRKEGYSLLTPVIITNSDDYSEIQITNLKDVTTKDELIKVIK